MSRRTSPSASPPNANPVSRLTLTGASDRWYMAVSWPVPPMIRSAASNDPIGASANPKHVVSSPSVDPVTAAVAPELIRPWQAGQDVAAWSTYDIGNSPLTPLLQVTPTC